MSEPRADDYDRQRVDDERHLALGTLSFALCFAAWGLVSAFAVRFRESFHLGATETSLLVAVPVLFGSLARLPMSMLTDRVGRRLVFTLLIWAVTSRRWTRSIGSPA